MKNFRLLVVSLMLIAAFAVPSFAEEASSITPPTSITDDFAISPINLQADTLYLPDTGQFAVGIGYTVATYREFLELRAETAYIATDSEKADKRTFMGVGIGVNVRKLIEQAGGTWAMAGLSPTLGVIGLYDATSEKKIRPAIYLSVLKVEF